MHCSKEKYEIMIHVYKYHDSNEYDFTPYSDTPDKNEDMDNEPFESSRDAKVGALEYLIDYVKRNL